MMIILGISIMLDWFHIYRNQRDLNFLDNYISFETKNINNKKLNYIRQIQTTIEFYPEARMNRFKNMLNVDSKDAEGLEDVILSWHPEADDFDSISYIADRLLIHHIDVMQTKDRRIGSFYEARYVQELLEYLSQFSRATSIGCYFGFDMARSVVEDSVYIGNYGLSDDHIKFAFKLNESYFPSNPEGIYKIPWSDKLNVEMLIMRNRLTYIDTAIQKQTILKTDGAWRSAALSFGQSK